MADFTTYFSVQIFFIILRETLETAIIISVLLSFINKREPLDDNEHASHIRAVNAKHRFQVWAGAVAGLAICLLIGLVFMFFFYFVEQDLWSYTERIWEGVFSLLSSVIITVMGIGLLRINKVMKIKWWIKLGDAYKLKDARSLPEISGEQTGEIAPPSKKQKFSEKYFLAILPLVTTLREGLEAVVFVGGIGMSQPLTSLPLAAVSGVAVGSCVGYFLYKGGNKLSLQYFLICLTCFLYIVSAGLMSRGVWFLELESYVRKCGGTDVSETGSGPGSYDVSNTIWHVNCCNGLRDGWWMVANAIVGWTNTATYGSVISYMMYWLVVIVWLRIRLYEERHGLLPILPIKWQLRRIRKRVQIYEMRQRSAAGEQ